MTLLQPHGMRPVSLLCPWNFKQKYWSGLPFPTARDLPNPGIKPISPALTGRIVPLNHLGSPQITQLSPSIVFSEVPHFFMFSLTLLRKLITFIHVFSSCYNRRCVPAPGRASFSLDSGDCIPSCFLKNLIPSVICFPSCTKLSVIPSIKNRQQTNSHCL